MTVKRKKPLPPGQYVLKITGAAARVETDQDGNRYLATTLKGVVGGQPVQLVDAAVERSLEEDMDALAQKQRDFAQALGLKTEPVPPGSYTMRFGKKGFEVVNAKKRKPKPDPFGRPWRVVDYAIGSVWVVSRTGLEFETPSRKVARLIVKAVNAQYEAQKFLDSLRPADRKKLKGR